MFFCSHPNAYLSKEIAAYKSYFCSEKQGFPTVPGNIVQPLSDDEQAWTNFSLVILYAINQPIKLINGIIDHRNLQKPYINTIS